MSKINNTHNIVRNYPFEIKDDCFITVVILNRKHRSSKHNKNVVDYFPLYHIEDLFEKVCEIEALCSLDENYRAYILLEPRLKVEVSHNFITENLYNKEIGTYKYNLLSSIFRTKPHKLNVKTVMYDIDTKDNDIVEDILNSIGKDNIKMMVDTVKGYHVIANRSVDTRDMLSKYGKDGLGVVEKKKDNFILLFANGVC